MRYMKTAKTQKANRAHAADMILLITFIFSSPTSAFRLRRALAPIVWNPLFAHSFFSDFSPYSDEINREIYPKNRNTTCGYPVA